jgi:hypothetical protein
MCIDYVFKKRETVIKNLQERLTVYKVVKKKNNNYYPLFMRIFKGLFSVRGMPFKKGKNKLKFLTGKAWIEEDKIKEIIKYRSGFHSFQYKEDAEKYARIMTGWPNGDIRIVECQILKKWITTVGKIQMGQNSGITFITNQIIFPK